MKLKNYSKNTDNYLSVTERIITTIRNLLKKPVFIAGKASWISELPTFNKQYNDTTHHSIKVTPVEVSLKTNEKVVFSNLKDKREKPKPKINLGDLVRSADINIVFSERKFTNWSFILHTTTEVIDDTILSKGFNYSPERYNEIFLRSTNLTPEKIIRFLKNEN